MPPDPLEHAWRITESLHALLTENGPTDWPVVATLAEELRAVADTAGERAPAEPR
jgi:hypothetical protein